MKKNILMKELDVSGKAINTLLSDLTLRGKHGRYARERVHKEFTREVMLEKILEVYS